MMLAKRRWIIRAFLDHGFESAANCPVVPPAVVFPRGALVMIEEERHHGFLQSPSSRCFQIAVAQSGKLLAVVRFHPGGMTQPVITSAREAVVSGGFQLLVLAAADQIDGFR